MKSLRQLSVSFLLFCAFTSSVLGQSQSFGFGLGAAAIRGDAWDEGEYLIDELGINLYGYHSFWWDKFSGVQFIGHVRYNDLRVLFDTEPPDTSALIHFEARSYHLGLSFGIRYYLDPDLNKYSPSAGQGSFFGGARAGVEIFGSKVEQVQIDQLPGKQFSEETFVSPNAGVELGYRLFITQSWSVETSFDLIYGFSDYWDGLSGPTGVKDWLASGSVGFSISL